MEKARNASFQLNFIVMKINLRFSGLKSLCSAITAAFLLANIVFANNPDKEIDSYIKLEMAKYKIPGLSLAVVKNGKIVKLKGYGISSVEFNQPTNASMVFQLYSTTKIFAGVAVMKLVEAGKLSLDTPVTDIFEKLPKTWNSIYIRNLLNHTSGLPELSDNPHFKNLPDEQRKSLTKEDLLAFVAETPLRFPAGEKFSYHRFGYVLLGMIVEKLSGKNYSEFLTEQVLKPLEMNSTQYGDSSAVIQNRPSTPYTIENGKLGNTFVSFGKSDPGAGLNSSVADLAKFFVMLEQGKILKPESFQEIWLPMKLRDGKESSYGLGWDINDHKGLKVVGHEGGGAAWIAYFPSEHLSVIVLCNLNGARADEIQYGIADFYLNKNESKNSASIENNSSKDKSMVLISGATFKMGTDSPKVPQIAETFKIQKHPDLIQSETPRHTVTLSSFYLDKYEVTNAKFQKFIKKNPEWTTAKIPKQFNNGNYLKDWNGSEFPKDKADHPVTNISWYAAVAYCQSVEKRLPTEAEWEYADRGGLTDKTFPWGDEPVDKARANYGSSEIKTTTPVGSYPANGYGLYDMAGNVWEFTADEWGNYSDAFQTNPVAGGNLFLDKSFYNVTTRRVIRGGSFGGAPLNLRVTYRDSHPPGGARDFVGFRCADSAVK